MQITVDWLQDLLTVSGVDHILFIMAMTIAIGTALGKIKICGVSLGATWILLVGIVISHVGMLFPDDLFKDEDGTPHFINPHVLGFVHDFGLILFVYAVGLRSGKSFFSTFKKGGVKLNLLVISAIALSAILAVVIHFTAKLDAPTTVGILSGAVTNTPGLGAAQLACKSLNLNEGTLAAAYAATYPLAVLCVIFTIVGIRAAFKIDLQREAARLQQEKDRPEDSAEGQTLPVIPHKVPILQIFVGVFLGVLFGSIPIGLPGIPQPLRLGLAGGPLIVALLLGAYGEKIKFPTRISPNMLLFMADIGNCLFMACIGLQAGETFVDSLTNGGLRWIGYGLIITLVPLVTVGYVAYKKYNVDFFTLAGILSGSMTSTPGLTYSTTAYENERVAIGYATVYPVTMFLRIMSAQLLVLFFA